MRNFFSSILRSLSPKRKKLRRANAEASSILKVFSWNPSGIRRFTCGCPSHNDIAGCFVAERLDRGFLVDFLGTVCYDSYLLGSCFFALLNSDGLEARQGAERRTDVLFASASRYAGHAGNICHVIRHCQRSKSEECQRHSCDNFLHGIDKIAGSRLPTATQLYTINSPLS